MLSSWITAQDPYKTVPTNQVAIVASQVTTSAPDYCVAGSLTETFATGMNSRFP